MGSSNIIHVTFIGDLTALVKTVLEVMGIEFKGAWPYANQRVAYYMEEYANKPCWLFVQQKDGIYSLHTRVPMSPGRQWLEQYDAKQICEKAGMTVLSEFTSEQYDEELLGMGQRATRDILETVDRLSTSLDGRSSFG